jgi:hypothetical protein
MAQNEHKKVLQELSEAYSQVNEGRLGNIAKGAALGAGTALVGGQLGPQIATPEELVTVPAGAVLGGIAGGLKDPEDAETRDDVGKPSWDAEWSTVDALADILADLSDTWQTGEYSDADKESLKKYINDFIDEEIDDRKIDDAPLPDHPAGNAWPPLGRAAAIRDAHPLFYK